MSSNASPAPRLSDSELAALCPAARAAWAESFGYRKDEYGSGAWGAIPEVTPEAQREHARALREELAILRANRAKDAA